MVHSWLWQNEQLSDVKLRLVCRQGEGDEPAPKRRKQHGEAQDRGACVMELSVHRVVLASTSGYWKSRLLRWDDKPTANSKQAAAKTSKAAQPAANCWVLEEQVVSSEAAATAQFVLRCAYTNLLPDSPTATLLMQMALLADKWDMPSVLSSCLTAAADVKDISMFEQERLIHWHLPDTITACEGYRQLQDRLGGDLCQHVGPAQTVVLNKAQLKSFRSLSLEAVLLWAAQDQLQTDSEDTVAVLLTHWWVHNSSGFGQDDRQAAARDLTQLLRAGRLSKSFILCALDQLPWFKCSIQATQLLRTLNSHDLQLSKQHAT